MRVIIATKRREGVRLQFRGRLIKPMPIDSTGPDEHGYVKISAEIDAQIVKINFWKLTFYRKFCNYRPQRNDLSYGKPPKCKIPALLLSHDTRPLILFLETGEIFFKLEKKIFSPVSKKFFSMSTRKKFLLPGTNGATVV